VQRFSEEAAKLHGIASIATLELMEQRWQFRSGMRFPGGVRGSVASKSSATTQLARNGNEPNCKLLKSLDHS
jgi:hypothetical protein